MKLVQFLLSICLYTSFVFADASLEQFKRNIDKYLMKAEAYTQSVNGLELKKLRHSIQKNVNFGQSEYYLLGSGEARTFATYYIESKDVVINTHHNISLYSDEGILSGLHESLGALGHNDEYYKTTLLIYLNAQGIDTKPYEKKLSEEARRYSNPVYENEYENSNNGGITGVGGGGDGHTLKIKMDLIDGLLNENFSHLALSNERDEIILKILECSIEPNYSSEAYFEKRLVETDTKTSSISYLNSQSNEVVETKDLQYIHIMGHMLVFFSLTNYFEAPYPNGFDITYQGLLDKVLLEIDQYE